MSKIEEMERNATNKIEWLLKQHSIKNKIDAFEQNWTKWSIDDTIEWFKYVLVCKQNKPKPQNNDENNENEIEFYDSDYSIENLDIESDTASENDYNCDQNIDNNDDEKKNEESQMKFNNDSIDFDHIKQRMIEESFILPKHFLLAMDKTDLKKIGFIKRNEYQLIYKQTKILVAKYPKGKRRKKSVKKQREENIVYNQIEGAVEDTGLH